MNKRAFMRALATAGLLAGVGVQTAAASEPWPVRPIKLVVPFPAGGNVDGYARVLAPALSRELKQPVVIENRPGAAGAIGVDSVARSAPDGYTVLMGNVTSVVGTAAMGTSAIADPLAVLAPVCTTISNEIVLFADKSSAIASIDDLKNKARQPVSFGSSGNGSISHLATLQLLDHLGVKSMHVPYKGNGQFLVDLLAGHIQLGLLDLTNADQHVQAGKLTPLVVTGKARFKELPDVPAIAELGITRPNFSAWIGLQVPVDTPAAIVGRLEQAARAAVKDPEVRAFASQKGNQEMFLDGKASRELIAHGLEDWRAFTQSSLVQMSMTGK